MGSRTVNVLKDFEGGKKARREGEKKEASAAFRQRGGQGRERRSHESAQGDIVRKRSRRNGEGGRFSTDLTGSKGGDHGLGTCRNRILAVRQEMISRT